MSEKLKEVYNDYFEERIDEWTAEQTAKGNMSAFNNKMRELTIVDADKLQKKTGRKLGDIDKYSTVRHSGRILFPHARERFLKQRGVDVEKVKGHLTKRGVKFSPKARVTVGERKYKDTKRKAFYVTQGRTGRRRRFWGYLD